MYVSDRECTAIQIGALLRVGEEDDRARGEKWARRLSDDQRAEFSAPTSRLSKIKVDRCPYCSGLIYYLRKFGIDLSLG